MRERRRPHFSLLGLGILVVLVLLAVAAAGSWLATSRGNAGSAIATASGQLPPGGTQRSAGASQPGGVTGSAGSGVTIKHIYLIVLENHPYGDVIGDRGAATINQLAASGGLATDYHSVGRPSQPNYIALVSGSTQGVGDDASHDLSAPNVADQLEAKGLNWVVWAENLPDPCYTGDTANGGADGDGTYARKHEPFISFTQISGDATRCGAHIHNLSAFDPAAGNFQLIVPNLCHDAHDCDLQVADQWLAGFAPKITDSAAFKDGGLLLIAFDEGDRFSDHIPLIAVGAGVTPGTQWGERRDHYALLRTVEDAFGLDCLAKACSAGNLAGLIGAP